MKKALLTFCVALSAVIAFAQTAPDFTANDCASASHNLYSELDAGKVIVISWVMPCGACIGPSIAAYNAVESYATSHPGQVFFYLADDYANTSCASLTSWGNTNSMPNAVKFSSSSVNMTGYGTPGMPKVVVLGGGSSHTIFYNQNSGVTTSNVQAAINSALATGINEVKNNTFNLNVFPNPVQGKTKLEYTLESSANITITIVNILGEEVKAFPVLQQSAGKHESQLNVEELSSGVYFIRLKTEDASDIIKITVTK